jgi:diguanylate cyclase (GGDEF)-like protein
MRLNAGRSDRNRLVVLDPANWSLVILPFFLLERRLHGASAGEPVSTAPQKDGLTGLPNQHALRLENLSRLAIIFDFDDLASLNSYAGFAAGDEALTGMASIIERLARSYGGTAYRIGGDEFLVVLPETATRHSATTLAHAVIENVKLLDISNAVPSDASLPPLSASAVIVRVTLKLAERIDEARAWVHDEIHHAKLVGKVRGGVVVDTSDRSPNRT